MNGLEPTGNCSEINRNGEELIAAQRHCTHGIEQIGHGRCKGMYEFVEIPGARSQINYMPVGDGHPHWMLDIAPEQVVIGGKPKEVG